MKKTEELQRLTRLYRERTGEKEIDHRKVAEFAIASGWPAPTPRSALDLLTEQISQAARQETRRDAATGKPYRANHALRFKQGAAQMTLWVDIDEATRPQILRSLMNRREQMVGDGLQLSLDADHWNRIHPQEEAIQIPMDFTQDIEWRKNAPDEDQHAA